MDNLPILYRNCLDQYPTQFGKDVWLWAVERPGMDHNCYAADRFTNEVLALVDYASPILDAAARTHGLAHHDPALMNFILARHANWRFGGNVKPSYALGEPPMKGDAP